jgi:hypothetical protein
MESFLNRRTFGKLMTAASVAGAGLSSSRRASAKPPALDLVSPEGQFHTFMKVYVSTAKARVWYWYTGVLDGSLVGGPVVPLFGTNTLIRRDITPNADGTFDMEMFEANYYHAIGDDTPRERMINALNGREVRPFPYREGPHRIVYSVDYDPYLKGTPESARKAARFQMRWHQAEDQLWFTRENYIDIPHPLPMDKWPMESSGARQQVGTFATHFTSLREAADPAVTSTRSAFNFEAFIDWQPWMLMGQTPGRLVWRAGGLKLTSLDDLPSSARAGFMATFPRIFEERPWEEFANMGIDYKAMRTPASP